MVLKYKIIDNPGILIFQHRTNRRLTQSFSVYNLSKSSHISYSGILASQHAGKQSFTKYSWEQLYIFSFKNWFFSYSKISNCVFVERHVFKIHVRISFYHSLCKFSRRQIHEFMISSCLPQKIGFNISCKLSQNLHEMSEPIFWENRKIFLSVVCWFFYPRY